jgi:hypothetical protein
MIRNTRHRAPQSGLGMETAMYINPLCHIMILSKGKQNERTVCI